MKHRNWSRLLATMLAGAMVLGLTACQTAAPQPAASTGTAESAPAAEAEAEAPAEEITLTITQWSQPSDDEERNIYKQFEKTHPGYKIDVQVIAEDQYSAKINQMISAGNAPDIVLAWECDLPTFAANKKVIALDDYLAKSDLVHPDDFIQAVTDLNSGMGGTYGLPYCYAAEIVYYNKDLFDAAGVDYPTNDWTMDDFVSAAEALTIIDENGAVQQYGCDGLSFVGGYWSGIGAAGDAVYNSDGKLEIGDGAVKFLTTQKYLVDNQICPAPSAESSDLFASGKAAMTRTGSWFLGSYKDLEFNWDIAPQPKDARFYNSMHTGMYCIPESTKNKDAAWTAIEWFMSEEGQTVLSRSSGNFSVTKSIAAQEAWKVQGTNGPSNWDAMNVIWDSAAFGYVCLPAGLTGDAVKQFEAAVLGQKGIEEAVADVMAEADTF